MSLKEDIKRELGEEFGIRKIEIEDGMLHGSPVKAIKVTCEKFGHEFTFEKSQIKTDGETLIPIMRSYMRHEKERA